MDGRDLRQYQNDDSIKDVFSKLVSGKSGYQTVIDKSKPVKKCECGYVLNDEKFCPECGKKVEDKQ